jgi:hypothetical protein
MNMEESFLRETDDSLQTYESIIGSEGGAEGLTSRLATFRQWIQEAGCTVHPAICIVNGEATDGTKNAPVLVLGSTASASSKTPATAEGRCGMIDGESDRILYDRTVGCHIRTVKEIREDQVMMTVPKHVMITPDLIAASDAGRAALACCEPLAEGANFWDAFGNTVEREKSFQGKVSSKTGTQLLVHILQERKKVETALSKAMKEVEELDAKFSGLSNRQKFEERSKILDYKLAGKGDISTRAAVLCFLIHQRFSNCVDPPVSSGYSEADWSNKDNASKKIGRTSLAPGTPSTFAPYARTLPPLVPLPICWKRNELALLAGCIPGVPLLVEIAAQIMTLSSDLISLVDAGILHRFPHIFPPNLITWDRWMWAASVHSSRILPATCYLNEGETKAEHHKLYPGEVFYSNADVWDELGVMVPLIDMLNHESEAAQITWEPSRLLENLETANIDVDVEQAKVIMNKRVKKGSQIYTNYGNENNKELILRYGFAQIVNTLDNVQIGWGLNDCVGNVSPPSGYLDGDVEQQAGLVYESSDTDAINAWWTDDRMELLQTEVKSDKSFWKSLRQGMKMTASAYSDGTYHPLLLTAIVVATISHDSLKKHVERRSDLKDGDKIPMTISKNHQHVIRKYMQFFFSRKFEKLMVCFQSGLKDHYNNVKLWSKITRGGILYKSSEEEDSENEAGYIGWQSFFDSFAYSAAVEVEKHYYAISPDSCVLTLYDGHLRSLQASVDVVLSDEKFKGVLLQLQELGFVLSDEDEEIHEEKPTNDKTTAVAELKENGKVDKQENNKTNNGNTTNTSRNEGEKKERSRNRRRSKNKGPPAIKLHIGNLSYNTLPSELCNYFAQRYGRENVLECHIPTERETGKSRGFGFVTMPEIAAYRALQSDQPHKIDGRLVKVAESNTAGGARGNSSSNALPVMPSDRCVNCGYRPKYCTCANPNFPAFHQHMGGPMPMMGGPPPMHMHPPDDFYGPGPMHPMGGGMDMYNDYGHHNRPMNPDFDSRGGRHQSGSWNRGRSFSRSPSSHYRGNRGDRDDRYYDNHYRERGRSRSYSRSRSRSFSRDRDRRRDRRDRHRDRDGRRSSRRSRDSGSKNWRSSRYSSSPSRSLSRSRSRSRSRSYSKEGGSSSRRAERERERRLSPVAADAEVNPTQSRAGGGRSNSRSASPPPQARESTQEHKKREGKKSHRSRSRERHSRSRKRSKASRRSKERSKRHHSSRSRSRSRSSSWKD